MKFSTFYNLTRKKSFFYYVILLGTCFCLISSFVLSRYAAWHEANSLIIRYNTQAALNLDKKIETTLHSYLESNLEHFMSQNSLSDFFDEEIYVDFNSFMKMRISIVDSLRFEPDIKDITLYRASDQSVISGKNSGFSLTSPNDKFAYVHNILNMDIPSKPDFISLPSGETYYYYPFSPEGAGTDRSQESFALASLCSFQDFFAVRLENVNKKGTFLVLNQGIPLSIEGNNVLSAEIILDLIENQPPNTLFTCSGGKLPSSYRFYYTPSRITDLIYVYYEPKTILPPSRYFSGYPPLHGSSWLFSFLYFSACILALCSISLLILKKSGRPENTAAPSLLSLPGPYLPEFFGLMIQLPDNLTENSQAKPAETIRTAAARYLAASNLSHAVTIQGNNIICLVNFKYCSARDLVDSFLQMLSSIQELPAFNLYHTDISGSMSSLTQNINYLTSHLSYTNILGYGQTISQEYIRSCEQHPDIIDQDAIATCKNLLEHRQFEDLSQYCRTNLNRIFQEPISCRASQDFIETVFYAVKSFFSDKGYSHPITHKTFTDMASDAPGAKALMDCLLSWVEEYQKDTDQSGGKKHMDAIYQYIDTHISTVTLNSMAEHFQLTPAHLSRLFKDNSGINFTDYLSEKKLQYAASLLREHTKQNIADISRQLGYNTPAYFSTRFKERFGQTPSDYRRIYMAAGEK